ncbi:Flavodoxin-like fold [Paracoccus isoporae]|uniref:Flavodoxin-like fold n=1 Tax=Paracoccus isoporae TaxID=591205 RepID=A0A1G6U752_9RHOB|nr:NAD(P)H-dependent oxidoreductase [Paracoccus isoporae]SDD37121.1 Flavodoxin-like fold [Paracoccus isoporae]
MNALLIVAHPVPASLNRHLAEIAAKAAQDAGASLRRIDLY